jgi:hypothetical protein
MVSSWHAHPEPPLPPLALTDDELSAAQRAAAPIHRLQRDAFLKALATELERHPVIGPGLVHRCAAELQRTFGVGAHSATLAKTAQGPRRATG